MEILHPIIKTDWAAALRREEAEAVPHFVAAYERAADADEDGMHPPTAAALLHEVRRAYGWNDDAIPSAIREHLAADWGVEVAS